MTPEMTAKLRKSLVAHEGYSTHLYADTVGKQTIGIGYCISDRGLPDTWVNTQYEEDVNYFYSQLNTFPWFRALNEDRQVALIDMSFMGLKRFLEFHGMIAALSEQNYAMAASEMLASEWANQVKGRAITLANAIRTGVYNP